MWRKLAQRFFRNPFENTKNSINEWFASLFGPTETTVINAATILRIPSVFRGAKIISEALASLPLSPYQIKSDGDIKMRPDLHDAYLLSVAPNGSQTAFNFWDAVVFNLVIHGNAIAIRRLNKATGQTREFHLVEYEEISGIFRDDDGLVYDLGKYGRFVESEVLHFASTSYNGIWGLSLIELFAETLATDRSTTKYSKKYYENGAIVRGILSTPGVLNDQTYKRVTESWNKNHVGVDGVTQTPLLEGGATYQSIAPKMLESGIQEIKKLTTEEIARMLGLPLHMLMDLSKSTNNNIAQQSLEFKQRVVVPYTARIVAELDRKIGSNRIRWMYDTTALLIGDMQSLKEFYPAFFNLGAINRNEIRKRVFNLPAVEGGDTYYIASNNLTPADKIAEKNEQSNTEGAGAPTVDLEPSIQQGS